MKRPHDYSSPDSDTDELIDVGQEDSYCPVTGSMSPGSTSQILARKKRRGIIEKRRRDRINHSLSELRRLVPSAFEKQGSSKLEKAEILQMTVDHLKLLHAMGGKGYFDARALAVDYRTLGFRECVGEVVRYLSSLEGVESADPIGARLVSHLSHCASELDPVHQSPSTLPFTPWPWGSFPQLGGPSSPPITSAPFTSDGRRDLTPHAALLAYPSPALRVAPLGSQGALLSPAISLVRRLPSITSRPHRLPEPPREGPTVTSPLHSAPPAPPSSSSSSPSSISSSSPSSSSAGHPHISFRPFAALGPPAPGLRGMSVSSKTAQAWGTEIGAF
ncbi:hairy/enhancer-of-split related with YRPW motif-like protein [Astyanax mexicanus]|uniref:Hes related family bHLH transcription factor with YRPW motif like n=1 Tax=Astyanax mexicanus TaxID=7994 RepID=A0A3B1IN91_ASTMX|nr:hairy/enhancer-of-split related with YRPW motif-like protein [Astyanax mexicanus]